MEEEARKERKRLQNKYYRQLVFALSLSAKHFKGIREQ